MKKVLSICLALVMVLCMSLTAFAAPENFVSSPSGNSAPILVESTPESEDCEADLVITPYSDRDELPAEVKEQMQKAYDEIVKATELTDLNEALAQIAKNKNIPVENLTVSDLFDIRYISCDEHEDHGKFEIVIKADTLKKFVALLHYNNGNWDIVDNAEVKEVNGELRLTFSISEFSPFAIVVDSEGVVNDNPQTGEGLEILIPVIILLAVSGLAIVLFLAKKSKKQDA